MVGGGGAQTVSRWQILGVQHNQTAGHCQCTLLCKMLFYLVDDYLRGGLWQLVNLPISIEGIDCYQIIVTVKAV